MTLAHEALPYRPNVGAALFNRDGLVFIGRRATQPGSSRPGGAWQLPQGGIDAGEAPSVAVLRELNEEIGTDRATILGEHDAWLTYDMPPELIGAAFGGRYRGQRQRWFALRFDGQDSDIRLDTHGVPEFDAWRWLPLNALPDIAVHFKRPIYEAIAQAFIPFAEGAAGKARPGALPLDPAGVRGPPAP
jgi:putative (di)nucleoside polyphosphate hydrolase